MCGIHLGNTQTSICLHEDVSTHSSFSKCKRKGLCSELHLLSHGDQSSSSMFCSLVLFCKSSDIYLQKERCCVCLLWFNFIYRLLNSSMVYKRFLKFLKSTKNKLQDTFNCTTFKSVTHVLQIHVLPSDQNMPSCADYFCTQRGLSNAYQTSFPLHFMLDAFYFQLWSKSFIILLLMHTELRWLKSFI